MVSSFPLFLFVQVNGSEMRKTMRKAEEKKKKKPWKIILKNVIYVPQKAWSAYT